MTPARLRQFRVRLNLTQAEFAKCIGVAPNTVARWERGELNMRASTARFLEVLVQNTDLTNPTITNQQTELATSESELPTGPAGEMNPSGRT